MLPAYPSFDTDEELSSLPQKWEDWAGGLEDLMSSLDCAVRCPEMGSVQFEACERSHSGIFMSLEHVSHC